MLNVIKLHTIQHSQHSLHYKWRCKAVKNLGIRNSYNLTCLYFLFRLADLFAPAVEFCFSFSTGSAKNTKIRKYIGIYRICRKFESTIIMSQLLNGSIFLLGYLLFLDISISYNALVVFWLNIEFSNFLVNSFITICGKFIKCIVYGKKFNKDNF